MYMIHRSLNVIILPINDLYYHDDRTSRKYGYGGQLLEERFVKSKSLRRLPILNPNFSRVDY